MTNEELKEELIKNVCQKDNYAICTDEDCPIKQKIKALGE